VHVCGFGRRRIVEDAKQNERIADIPLRKIVFIKPRPSEIPDINTRPRLVSESM